MGRAAAHKLERAAGLHHRTFGFALGDRSVGVMSRLELAMTASFDATRSDQGPQAGLANAMTRRR
jgi:hypothetical protein